MRNWEKVVKKYIGICETRGLVRETIEYQEKLLLDWGIWLRMQEPVPGIEEVCENADYIIKYIVSRSAFRAKGTVSKMVSVLRCMGRFLVEEGVWRENPLRWIRGPKLYPYSKLPKRITRKKMEQILRGAAEYRRTYDRVLMMTIVTLLYSTGMRRGELAGMRVSIFPSLKRSALLQGCLYSYAGVPPTVRDLNGSGSLISFRGIPLSTILLKGRLSVKSRFSAKS